MMIRLMWPLLLAAIVGSLVFLPSPRPSVASHGCAGAGSPAGPFDLQAYEAADWPNTYRRTLEFAAFNELFPELPTFALPPLETGPRSANSSATADPYVPPVILKAIAWIESAWQMGGASVDFGAVGPPILSHSCAYGLMQIVTGMENKGNLPTLDQVSIGSHFGFNIARGARILAGKWNQAPEFRPLVGERDPSVIESWYYAIWSYHGFAFVNHPANPSFSPQRGVYRCDGTQSFGSFPYQELVLGCVANPPVVGGVRLWDPVEVTLPKLSDPALSDLANWDDCFKKHQCKGMDLPVPKPAHSDPRQIGNDRTVAIGSPAMSVGPRSVTLVADPGRQAAPVTVSIANAGTGPLAWRFSSSVSWVRYSRFNGIALGSDIGSQPSQISLWASAQGLDTGTYTGTITVQTLYGFGSPQTIDVTLVVKKRSFLPGVARG